MEPTGAEESGGFRPLATLEDLLLNNPEDWLAEAEARLDQRVLGSLPPAQRAELNMMAQGMSVAGIAVDLDAFETKLDVALLGKMSPAQQAELELIMRGESPGGVRLDLDALEEYVDRDMNP